MTPHLKPHDKSCAVCWPISHTEPQVVVTSGKGITLTPPEAITIRSQFVKRIEPRPATVEFLDGARLRWVGKGSPNTEVVRMGGRWYYIKTDEEDEGIRPGMSSVSDDRTYAEEFMTGKWIEI